MPRQTLNQEARSPKPSISFRLLAYLAIASALVFFAVGAWAQSQSINGSIRGRVADVSGATVPDAAVTVENTDTGYTRSLQTNADGAYLFPNLPLGSYTVLVKKDGFAEFRATRVVLTAGREAVIDAALQLSGVSTTVEVSGGAPVVETTRINVGRTIDTTEVENLPLPSRNPYNFILFQPGVSGHPNPELGIPRTLNTNGLLNRINYQMDGMVDTQTDRHGLRLFPISDTFVREVQTVSNSYAPEFGQTSGNIYNVITNSGTNDLHGMFQYMHRWIDATARPILSNPTAPKPELKLNDYSTNAGGRLIKDRLFWFGAYEHLERGVPTPITITQPDAAALGIPSNLLGSAPGLLHGQFVDTRLDWVINAKHTAFLRYNYFRNDFPLNTSSGGLSALDAYSDYADRAHVIGTQIVSTFTPTLLNEFRFSWPLRKNSHFNGSLTGPGPVVNVSGHAIFNGTTGAGDRFVEKIPNFNENISWIKGKHSFKFGGSWQENLDLQRSTAYTQYTFASIADYLSAKSGANPYAYSSVTVSNGGKVPTYRSTFFSFYGQDSWRMTQNLLVMYGVRYDKFAPPDSDPNAPFIYSRKFNSPSADFAPRVGLAYSIRNNTVLRASGGIFYDAPATNTWFNTLLNNGNVSSTTMLPTSPGAPTFGTILTDVPPVTGVPQSVTTVSPNFRNAYTINASVQLEQGLGQNDSIVIGYLHSAGRNLEFLRNMNLINPIGELADGRPVFSTAVNENTRLFPQFNNITLQDSGARSNYDAGILTYTHRMSRGMQVSASYTWSHSISDAPEANGFEQNLPIEDPTNRLRDRGNSLANRPHALTISSILQPSVNWDNAVLRRIVNDNMFAILANISSGDQQNITTGKALNGDPISASVTRPLFVGRNSVRGPNIYQVDMRYTRTFATLWERVKPQFMFEVNNLFNHPNVTGLNATATVNTNPSAGQVGAITKAPTLAPVSTSLEGRIVQFGLAVRF